MQNQFATSCLTNVRGRIAILFAVALATICWSGSFFGERTVALAATTPAFVQEKDNQAISGKTISVTLAAPSTPDNYIVAYLIWDNTASANVSDSFGNTHTMAVCSLAPGSPQQQRRRMGNAIGGISKRELRGRNQ